jgi:hypothetical protein
MHTHMLAIQASRLDFDIELGRSYIRNVTSHNRRTTPFIFKSRRCRLYMRIFSLRKETQRESQRHLTNPPQLIHLSRAAANQPGNEKNFHNM